MLADNNFEFGENGGEIFKGVENIVGKGEIARYEQFLLFPRCFLKTYTTDTQKPGLIRERVLDGLSLTEINDRAVDRK